MRHHFQKKHLLPAILLLSVFLLAAVGIGAALTGAPARAAAREAAAGDARSPGLSRAKEAAAPAAYASPVDFTALRSENPDVIGWIRAPGLGIDQPILQGGDNDEYLRTTMDGSWSIGGSVFLDWACAADLSDLNTVIYGHNTHDGGMFSNLEWYKDPEKFAQYRDDITLYLPDRAVPLRVVAAGAGPSEAFRRTCSFASAREFNAFCAEVFDACPCRELPEEPPRQIFSLITCSYEGPDWRMYVYAVERP